MIPFLLAVSVMLFGCGLIGIALRRNLFIVLMSIELMLAGVALAMVTFARMHGNLEGQVFAFFMIVVAAVEAGIGFGLILALHRKTYTLDSDKLSNLRW